MARWVSASLRSIGEISSRRRACCAFERLLWSWFDLFLEFAQGFFELERVRRFVHETVKATTLTEPVQTGRGSLEPFK